MVQQCNQAFIGFNPIGCRAFFLFSLPVHAVSVLNQASLGEKRILLDLVSGRKERGGWVDVENVASDILVSLSQARFSLMKRPMTSIS